MREYPQYCINWVSQHSYSPTCDPLMDSPYLVRTLPIRWNVTEGKNIDVLCLLLQGSFKVVSVLLCEVLPKCHWNCGTWPDILSSVLHEKLCNTSAKKTCIPTHTTRQIQSTFLLICGPPIKTLRKHELTNEALSGYGKAPRTPAKISLSSPRAYLKVSTDPWISSHKECIQGFSWPWSVDSDDILWEMTPKGDTHSGF